MTEIVARFLETNKSLLDKDLVEFFHSAHNGLSNAHQAQVVEALETAGIDTYSARERVMLFVITMETEVLERKCSVDQFVSTLKYGGLLGFDHSELVEYIMENANEWDVNIEYINHDYYLVPREV